MNLTNVASKSIRVVLWLSFFIGTLFASGKVVDLMSAHRVPATLGNLFVFTDLWDKGYFNATGTWNSSGEKRVDRLNAVEIICSLPRKICSVSLASLNQYDDSKPYLSTSLDIFDVERWDSHVINFREEKQCAETVFSVNRETKTVSALRKYHTTVSGCSPSNVKEINYSLVSGFDVYMKLKKEDDGGFALFIFIATIALLVSGFGVYRVFKPTSK